MRFAFFSLSSLRFFPFHYILFLTNALFSLLVRFSLPSAFFFSCAFFFLFQCVLRFFLLQNILFLTTALFSLLVRFFHFPVRFSPFQCVFFLSVAFCVFFSFPVPFAFFFPFQCVLRFLLHRSVSLLSVASTIKPFSTMTHSLLK